MRKFDFNGKCSDILCSHGDGNGDCLAHGNRCNCWNAWHGELEPDVNCVGVEELEVFAYLLVLSDVSDVRFGIAFLLPWE